MKKCLKYAILLLYTALVIFLIIYASGYTPFTSCKYYSAGSNSLVPILGIALLSFIVGLVLKMEKDRRYVFVVSVSIASFFVMFNCYDRKYNQLLENREIVVTKAIIYDIGKHQFSTFLAFKTIPKKIKGQKSLKKKSDLGRLKIGDTILIKYVQECSSIFDFYNLSPTKEELAKY